MDDGGLLGLFYKGTIPFMRALSHDLIVSQKQFLSQSHWDSGFQQMTFCFKDT